VSLSAATRAEIEKARDRYPQPRSAILPSLWAVQREVGFVSDDGMETVAEILGLAPSEVQAVSTFYSMYFDHAAGEHHILVCINVACALRGADETVEYIERKLGCPSGSTTADGKFTWESTIECLGACGYAPMMQIDHRFHEHLTPERIDAILERVAAEPGHHGHRAAPPPAAAVEALEAEEPPAEASPGKQPSKDRSRQRRALRDDGEAK
jgi:NADH-quinone oxidoreductase subunit E